MKKILILLTAIVLFSSCETRQQRLAKRGIQTESESTPSQIKTIISEGQSFDTYKLIKIRNCEYVIYDDPSGVGMQHAGDCTNPDHNLN